MSISDTKALRHGFSVGKSTSEGDSTGETNSTGTSSHLDLKVPGVISAATGIGGGTSTSASNNSDVRHDMTVKEQQDFQTALDKVKTAARSGSLTSTNSDDIRLNKSFASNLSKLDQIGHEESKARQDVDTFSRQLSYAQTHAGTIDRNANDLVMKDVMRRHPELRSKEQAVRWMNTHRAEADAIAQPIITSYNPFDASSTHIDPGTTRERAADLTHNTQAVKNMVIATPENLEEKHAKNQAKVQKYTVVKDVTGEEKPLENVVNDATKNSNLGYNQDVGKVFNKNLDEDEQIIVKNLNNERNKGKDSKSGEIFDNVAKGIVDTKSLAGQSTVLRVAKVVVEDIGDTSTAAINLVTDSNKND